MIEIFFFMAIDILKDVGPITYNSFEMLAIGSPIATILYGAWIFLIKWRIKQTINVVEQKAFSILYVKSSFHAQSCCAFQTRLKCFHLTFGEGA